MSQGVFKCSGINMNMISEGDVDVVNVSCEIYHRKLTLGIPQKVILLNLTSWH